jgi:preprotein translocase subunit SecE
MFDKLKLGFAILLVIAGIAAFYVFQAQVPSVLYRTLGLIVVIGVAVAVAVTTQLGGQVVAFSRSAAMEMRKTVWPTRRETTQTTLIVVVAVTLLGFLIWLIDQILRWVVEWFLHLGA